LSTIIIFWGIGESLLRDPADGHCENRSAAKRRHAHAFINAFMTFARASACLKVDGRHRGVSFRQRAADGAESSAKEEAPGGFNLPGALRAGMLEEWVRQATSVSCFPPSRPACGA
jgi:hypothetical protein